MFAVMSENKKFIEARSSAIRLFLKMTFLFGISLGLPGSILFFLNSYNLHMAIVVGIIISLTAGIAFALPMTILQIVFANRVIKKFRTEKKNYSDVYGVIHNRTVKFRGSLDQARDKCLAAIERLKGIKSRSANDDTKVIKVRTSANFLTTGEKISILFFEKDDQIEIEVNSRPALKTTIVDFGKNLKNTETLIKSFAD